MRDAEPRDADPIPNTADRGIGAPTRRARRAVALLVALAATLVAAAPAAAELGIVGWYDTPTFPEEPELSSPRDAVVNGSGAGNAEPGDFYIANTGSFGGQVGQSINQYDVDGNRVRIFGEDVVASGPGSSNERQSVAIFAEGGTFTLSFGGEATAPLAYNATPATVEAALDALPSIGGVGGDVTVTGGPGSPDGATPYLVTFSGTQGGASQPLLIVNDGGLTGTGATSFVASPNKGGTGKEVCETDRGDICKRGLIGYTQIALSEVTGDVFALGTSRVEIYGADGEYKRAFGFDVTKFGPNDGDTDEVDTLTIKATGGTFTLRTFLNGERVTAPIPWNATAAEVEAAINALPEIGTSGGGAVSVTGGPGDETGTSPYVVTFGGVNAGDNVNNFEAIATNLTGPEKAATMVTTTPGGEAEICTLADVCGSSFSESPKGGSFSPFSARMNVAPQTAPNAGNILISDGGARVQEFDGEGHFLRAIGWDVVAEGPNQNREPQSISVAANSGTYTITFEGQTTGAIAYNAPAATIETELNALSSISGVGSSVTVSGGVGNSSGTNPYVVVFSGTLAGTNPPFMTTDTSLLSGGGFQGPQARIGGGFSVCTASEECRRGLQGNGLGQFSQHIEGLAVDSTGAIYVADGRYGGSESNRINYRVEKFVPSGGDGLTPEHFGNDEVQTVTVKATGGSFKLGLVDSYGALGRGSFGSQQTQINNVTFEKGTFEVGMPIDSGTSGGSPLSARVAGISGNTVQLTSPIGLNCGNCQFSAPEFKYTPDLPAGATAAEVEAALNNLGPIKDKGGSVTVTGGPGDETGSVPYVVTFSGGTIARTSQPQIVTAQGGTPLSGGSGPGANEATPATTTNGGPNAQSPGLANNSETGSSDSYAPISLDVGPAGNVVVARNYPPGWSSCENGLLSFKEVRVEEFSSAGDFLQLSKPCTSLRQSSGGQSGSSSVSFNQATGAPYMWQPEDSYTKPDGSCCENRNRFYLLGDAGTKPTLVVSAPSNLSPTGVTISGTINPNGPGPVAAQKVAETKYRVEYKKPSDSTWEVYAPDVSVGGGTAPVPFSVGISGLTPKATYEARVVVTKPFGFVDVIGVSDQFTTLAAPPQINAVSADHITANSADLHALINPLGTESTYHFEYGPTPAYGLSTPETNIGDSLDPVTVANHIEALEPVVYHFRVVATNALGTVSSTDQTFNFYPEQCPNATVRQQTGSGQLPDCRAYELVSAEDTGSSTLLPGGPSSDQATTPSRFPYLGAFGSIPGPWNPPNTMDMYVATRTNTGWKTNYVGIPGDQAGATTGPPNGEGDPTGGNGNFTIRGRVMADTNLDTYIGWNPGQQGFTCCGLSGSMAPFVFDSQGNQLGRWPTNAEEVPDALKDMSCSTPRPDPPCGPTGGYGGDVRPSGDLSHYFFSSGNIAFAPGGLTSGMGSAYDNDIAAETVTVVSKAPGGGDIPKEPGVVNDDYLALPAASTDGSNILMAASGSGICGRSACDPMPFPCGISTGGFEHGLSIVDCPPLPPSHLYMRADNSITYDVSQGHLVDYKGATPDASKVFFSSTEQLNSEDEDTSEDLYVWNEDGDDITLVANGPGVVGNTDACNASWVSKCGVEIASPEYEFIENVPPDNVIDDSGGVYFYSPEQFVGSNGIPGRRNLYVRHSDGEIQYIATLEPNQAATRFEVTSDGLFAAFLTRSRLTAYDNQGFLEMYRFNTETGDMRCVSCLPTGDPPSSDVAGSQNGTYMTIDGRIFFATADKLIPQDTNGLIDVYEYVSGRPQLITTGIGQRDETLFGKTGLIGVSANGVDVFFSTFETLVPSDKNGAFLKFYNARTNGGFLATTEAEPCAAADECHGTGNSPAAPPLLGSTANLGSAGNLSPPAKKKAKKKKKGKKKKHGKRGKKKKKRSSTNRRG